MNRNATRLLMLLAALPLLTAAIWMDDQPSFKAYKAPVPPAPAGSVPVPARAAAGGQAGPATPLPASPATIEAGRALFEINCAMCHGKTSAKRGPVGLKLNPPPPGLDHELVQALSDSIIFQAMTDGFGRMPPFRDKLSVEERWELIHYLRTRR